MRRAALLPLLWLAGCASGFGGLERGNRAYRDGRFDDAVESYRAALAGREGSHPELRYNLGTALLRLGRYEEAERELREALRAVEPELRERVYYNLGNRFLEAARAEQEPAAAAQLFGTAADAYKETLRLAPADSAAKWNLELALREQERRRQQAGGQQSGESQSDAQQPRPEGEQGGGSGAEPREGQRAPGGAGTQPLTREQAERILAAVEQDERALFERKLRKGRRETPVARDW